MTLYKILCLASRQLQQRPHVVLQHLVLKSGWAPAELSPHTLAVPGAHAAH